MRNFDVALILGIISIADRPTLTLTDIPNQKKYNQCKRSNNVETFTWKSGEH